MHEMPPSQSIRELICDLDCMKTMGYLKIKAKLVLKLWIGLKVWDKYAQVF